jgi:hypothetical protein
VIPHDIKRALIQRNEARAALKETEASLQIVLERHAGKTYSVEWVPFKVCGTPGRRYWRRMVSRERAIELRAAWKRS